MSLKTKSPTAKLKLLAWMIHSYTGLGGLLGLLALFFAASGDYPTSFLILFITLFIDMTDGMLARGINIRQVLPNMDGSSLDNVVDTFTYIWIPLFIMWHGQLLHSDWLIFFPAIAGLYAYTQKKMKTDDGYFLGFPSYWNVVALYLYWLEPSGWQNILLIIIPSFLTFVPTRYLYPSKNKTLAKPTWIALIGWYIGVVWLLTQSNPNLNLIRLSAIAPIYYLVASFYVEFKIRRLI